MVFCMLNEVRGSDITAFSESSRVGMDIINLCRKMQELHRPMLVVGGADAVWKYINPAWDAIVHTMVLIGRGLDIPTISGEDYLKRLQLRSKDAHALKHERSQNVYLDMFNAIRNAAFAIVPHGTVRKQDVREQLEGLASHAALALERARRMAEEAWAAAERPAGSSRDHRDDPPQSLASVPKTPPGPPLVGALRPPPPPPPRVAPTTPTSVWDTVVDLVWTREVPLAKAGVPLATADAAPFDSFNVPSVSKSAPAKAPPPKPAPPVLGVQVVDIDEDPPTPPCRLKTNVKIYNAEVDQRGRHAIDDTESAEASLKASVAKRSTTTARPESRKG